MRRALVYILVIFIGFSHPLAFALGSEFSAFQQLSNATRTAGGGVQADYWFLDKNNVKKVAKNHKATARQLARVFRKRALCGYGGVVTVIACGAIAGLGTSYILSALTDDGWIVDKENGRIYKQENFQLYFTDNNACVSSNAPVESLLTSPDSVASCIMSSDYAPEYWDGPSASYKPVTQYNLGDEHADVISSATEYYQSFDFGTKDRDIYIDTSSIDFTYTKANQKYTITNNFYIVAVPKTEREITDTELAEYVKSAPDDDAIALATSPDYIAEGHEPTQIAAANAEPTDDNPETSDPEAPTDPDTTPDTSPEASELPAFCEYASKLCDWLDWTKETPETPTDTETPLEDNLEYRNPAEFDKSYVNLSSTCPAPVSFTVSVGSVSEHLEFSYQPMCDFAQAVRPAIQFLGAYVAFGVISSAIRGAA